jgi:hypothetical protein
VCLAFYSSPCNCFCLLSIPPPFVHFSAQPYILPFRKRRYLCWANPTRPSCQPVPFASFTLHQYYSHQLPLHTSRSRLHSPDTTSVLATFHASAFLTCIPLNFIAPTLACVLAITSLHEYTLPFISTLLTVSHHHHPSSVVVRFLITTIPHVLLTSLLRHVLLSVSR